MVLAYHVIFTAYGFWLPNDPRGSWSQFVASWELLRFGKATTINSRRSVAWAPHDSSLREKAKTALKYPPVVFSGVQALSIARGFEDAIRDAQYVLWAVSIMPTHVHLVLRRHDHRAETVAGRLKSMATHRLRAEHAQQFGGRGQSPWAERCWKVYLNTDADIRRAIAYVENNPVKEGKRRQRWKFVTPYGSGAT